MSQRKFIDDYLLKMANAYKSAAAMIAAKYDEYRKTKDEIAATQNSRLLTTEGKRKKVDELSAKKNQLMKDIETIRADANGAAKKIKADADMWFGKYFVPSKEDIDPQTVALLDADIMRYDELMKMAETANTTTKRLIGKALERKGYKQESAALLRTVDAGHIRAMNEMMQMGDFYCGGARMSGYSICKTAATKFDEITAPIIAAAPRLVADTDYRTMNTTITVES